MKSYKNYKIAPIDDPMPVWDGIRQWMIDDTKELYPVGTFVGAFDNDRLVAAFSIIPWTAQCFQIHGGVSRDYWGEGSKICYDFGLFLFNTTECMKIVAIIPEFNRLMRRCLLSVGMKEEGRISKAFIKHYKIHDLLIFGIQRREVTAWPL